MTKADQYTMIMFNNNNNNDKLSFLGFRLRSDQKCRTVQFCKLLAPTQGTSEYISAGEQQNINPSPT